MVIGTKIIQLKIIPRSWKFLAITLFGFVFTADKRLIDKQVKNHELIHCQQQLEWLYIPFYILYIGEWLWYLAKYRDSDKAYRSISFEREAYDHEDDMDYLRQRRHFANYRRKM